MLLKLGLFRHKQQRSWLIDTLVNHILKLKLFSFAYPSKNFLQASHTNCYMYDTWFNFNYHKSSSHILEKMCINLFLAIHVLLPVIKLYSVIQLITLALSITIDIGIKWQVIVFSIPLYITFNSLNWFGTQSQKIAAIIQKKFFMLKM